MRLRTPFDAAFLAFIPIVAALNSVTLLYPKDVLRTLAVPMALWPAVVMGLRGPRPHESSLSPRAAQFEAASGDEVSWAGADRESRQENQRPTPLLGTRLDARIFASRLDTDAWSVVYQLN